MTIGASGVVIALTLASTPKLTNLKYIVGKKHVINFLCLPLTH